MKDTSNNYLSTMMVVMIILGIIVAKTVKSTRQVESNDSTILKITRNDSGQFKLMTSYLIVDSLNEDQLDSTLIELVTDTAK